MSASMRKTRPSMTARAIEVGINASKWLGLLSFSAVRPGQSTAVGGLTGPIEHPPRRGDTRLVASLVPPTVPQGARCHRDLLGLGCTARHRAMGVVHCYTSRLFEGLGMIARLTDRSLVRLFLGAGAPCRHPPCTMANSTAAPPPAPSQGFPVTGVTRGRSFHS